MAEPTVQELADSIAALMQQRLHLRGHDLQDMLRRGGRLLPAHVRRDAGRIASALPLAEHPKLARQLDLPRLLAAERRVLAWLRGVDPHKYRTDMMLSMLGGIALSLLVVVGAAVAVLVWRGLI